MVPTSLVCSLVREPQIGWLEILRSAFKGVVDSDMAKNRLKTSCTSPLIHCFLFRSGHSSRKGFKEIGLHLTNERTKRKAK